MYSSNLHTHTVYSDGKQTVEQNILKAIEKGFVSIGISDHSYTEFDHSYCMKKDKISDYKSEISKLREKYRGRIEVYSGIEFDGYSPVALKDGLDYVIGSCHYVKAGGEFRSVDHCLEVHEETVREYFSNDALAYARAYYDTVAELIPRMKPDIVGHFDLVSKFNLMDEENPQYQKYAFDALISCLEVTPVIEMNTGAIFRGYRKSPYPAPFLIKEIRAHGGKIILSSDSHDADTLDYYFDECRTLLKSLGVNSTVILKNGKFEEAAIENPA